MKGRRLIFAATSGRAGSHYLAQLLGSAEDVYATHESPPYMIGHHLRAVVDRPLAETYDNRRIKAMASRRYSLAFRAKSLMRRPTTCS